jgi:serine protease Do
MAFSFSFDGGNYLGIQPQEITRENMSRYGLSAPRGVGIGNVSEGSPAERAGLKKGDVILQFDGEPVTSTRKLLRLLGEAAPEQTVRLTISRNGSEQQITATLGHRANTLGGYRLLTPGVPQAPNAPNAPRVWNDGPGNFSFSLGSNRRVGIASTTLTKQLADFFGVSGGKGLLITSVSENSPASKAGLKAGDVITEVNGEKVEDTGDFIRALNQKDEGDITLTIIRDRSQRTIKVTPERRRNPAINLSDLQPGAISRAVIPQIRIEMPELNIPVLPQMNLPVLPQINIPVLPKLEIPVLPKIDVLVSPKMMKLPHIERLLNDYYF